MSDYGYQQKGGHCSPGKNYGESFILVVVLFILLIIVGASFY